jgi:hypothetical protein
VNQQVAAPTGSGQRSRRTAMLVAFLWIGARREDAHDQEKTAGAGLPPAVAAAAMAPPPEER